MENTQSPHPVSPSAVGQNTNIPNMSRYSLPEGSPVIHNVNNVHIQELDVLPRQAVIPPPQFGYSWIPSDVYNYRPSFNYCYDPYYNPYSNYCPSAYPRYAPRYYNRCYGPNYRY
jgi:hypothetical protein